MGLGDLTKDMAFRLNFAGFETNRGTVMLLPLELNGGIAAIDLNFDIRRVRPGTTIMFEVQAAGVGCRWATTTTIRWCGIRR